MKLKRWKLHYYCFLHLTVTTSHVSCLPVMSPKLSCPWFKSASLFVLFIVAVVLSVLLFEDSDYPFGIFKLFLHTIESHLSQNLKIVFKTWLPLLHGPFISISLCTYMMLYSVWLILLLWRSIQSQTLLQFVSGSLISGDTENKTSEYCQCLMFAIPFLVHIPQVRCSLNCIYN